MAQLDISRYKHVSDLTPTNLIADIITLEGGYVNHKNDRGGETNWGITKVVADAHKHLWVKHHYNGNMRDLPKSLAYDIYYESFWKKAGCHLIYDFSPVLAFQVFDVSVNMGPGRAVKFLQNTLNILNRNGKDYPDMVVDGDFGPTTHASLKAYLTKNKSAGIINLTFDHIAQQQAFYRNLATKDPSQEVFANGWYNRVASKFPLFGRFLI